MQDKMKARYLIQRSAFPQKKTGELIKAGQAQAFQWAIGYVIGWHDAKELEPAQSPALFFLQVRGADDYLGLDKFGKEKVG